MRSGREDVVNLNSATIRADGWTALVMIPDAVVGGAYDLGTDAEPAISMTVTSKSWSVSGVETTLNRTVYGKAALRKPYPNQLVKDEVVNGTGIDVPVVLNDYIYADETISNVSIAAGFHTDNGAGGSGLPSAAQTEAPTNSSTKAYHKPIAMWLNHDLDWVKDTTYNVQMAVAHKDFRSGLPVRAVKFIATDQHSNTTSVIASTMVKRDFAVTGLSAPVFSGDLDFTGLTQGDMVSIDAIIYPWIGDTFQVSVDADTYPSPNLTVLKVLNDRTGGYGTAYAYVDGVGGGTPACHTNPATAATTPYPTIALAATGLQTYNNTTFGRNNASGGIIRLTATTHTQSSFSTVVVGEIPLIVESSTIEDKATTIFQNPEVASAGIPYLLKLRGLTIKKTGASIQMLNNGATVATMYRMLIVDNCSFVLDSGATAYAAWFYRTGRTYFIDCDGDNCGQAAYFSASARKEVISIGCSFPGCMDRMTYNAIGCKATTNTSWYGGAILTDLVPPKFNLFGWCHIVQPTSAANCITVGGARSESGIAVVGSVLEQAGGGVARDLSMFGDGNTSAFQNILCIGVTGLGPRANVGYNDNGVLPANLGVTWSQSVHYECNTKSDCFAPGSAGRIGNWPVIYKVGSKFRADITGSADLLGVGPGNWLGEIDARGDAHLIDPDFVNDQSHAGGGEGFGDYTPGPATEIPQIPAGETAYPWDLYGRAIPTDGTAYVGAVQKEAA